MLYVEQSLSPGEKIVFVGQFHWLYTAHAVSCIAAGILGAIVVTVAATYYEMYYSNSGIVYNGWLDAVRSLNPGIKLGAFIIFIMGLLRFAHMMVIRAATEVAVTTSRLIYKRGLIARYVGEMSIERVVGINVVQSAAGRIFGYGRLLVRGMGQDDIILPPLADPIALRKAIEKARTE